MKNKGFIGRVFIILFIMSFMFTMTGSAASTTKALSTNYTVVNMEDEPGSVSADVTAEYFTSDGSVWEADPDKTDFTVDGNFGQKVIAQYFDSTMTPGQGSAVLSSSQPLGAVVTIQARGQVPTNGAYTGYSEGSEDFYVPLVIRKRATVNGLANTQIVIQNTTDTQLGATVHFIASPGSGYSNWTTPSLNIPAFSSYYYDIEEESSANLPDGWYGSASVSSDVSGKDIAVVFNVFTGPNGLQTVNAFPAEKSSSTWAIPQFASRLPNGFSTSVNIQNISGGDFVAGDIDVNCIPAAGYTGDVFITNSGAVPNNATFGVNPVTDMSITGNWQGACTITAPGNIVAIATLRTVGMDNIAAYEAFPSTSSDTRVIVPLMAKRLANGFATVAVIQNLDPDNVATVRLTYTRAPGFTVGDPVYVMENVTIPAGGNVIQNLRLSSEPVGITMPDGWQGTLLVETQPSTTAYPLVAYVALTNVYTTAGDTYMAHDAFNLP
jgi:hypothetical protein